jgi:hypothetical protein
MSEPSAAYSILIKLRSRLLHPTARDPDLSEPADSRICHFDLYSDSVPGTVAVEGSAVSRIAATCAAQ